ncbi:MAG: hypothetical protein JWM68_1825 [Verrucomicrobiales bacterium]|nr:hypothetical protein [Verrucomicrobiales bacterium]
MGIREIAAEILHGRRRHGEDDVVDASVPQNRTAAILIAVAADRKRIESKIHVGGDGEKLRGAILSAVTRDARRQLARAANETHRDVKQITKRHLEQIVMVVEP